MRSNYSRRANVEERKNIRRAYALGILSIGAVLFLFFLGIPTAAKVATIISDFLQNSQTIDRSDTTPPASPRFDDLPEYSNQNDLEITGSTEPGATVMIFTNDDFTEVLANSEGSFRSQTTLKSGENVLYAKAKDAAGNESQKTTEYIVNFDKEPPELSIEKPQDKNAFYGEGERNQIIEGVTEEGATVHVNDRIAIVNSSGKFTLSYGLNEGENELTVTSEDRAGNKTETKLTVTYSK